MDLADWQGMVDRLGWQVYLTSTTAEQYAAPTLVAAYRQQALHERGFARLKTRNLHIRPLYLSNERCIAGLTWLLCLVLRVLTLTEYRLRTALQQRGETLAALNPAARRQTTLRPTTERVIVAFQHLTRTAVTLPDGGSITSPRSRPRKSTSRPCSSCPPTSTPASPPQPPNRSLIYANGQLLMHRVAIVILSTIPVVCILRLAAGHAEKAAPRVGTNRSVSRREAHAGV